MRHRNLIIMAILGVSLFTSMQNAFAWINPHYSYLYVAIDNRSNANYLFQDSTADGVVLKKKDALSKTQTTNAFVVKKNAQQYLWANAPIGTFEYMNHIDHTVCQFKFDLKGVSLTNANTHCSVINDPPKRTDSLTTIYCIWPVEYRWSAVITII